MAVVFTERINVPIGPRQKERVERTAQKLKISVGRLTRLALSAVVADPSIIKEAVEKLREE